LGALANLWFKPLISALGAWLKPLGLLPALAIQSIARYFRLISSITAISRSDLALPGFSVPSGSNKSSCLPPAHDSDHSTERVKTQIRAKVEHPFHVVKNLFRHRKVRYRGC